MERILKTTLSAEVRGQPQPRPYVARLIDRGDPLGVEFQPGQVFADGSVGWLGGWYLWSLLRPPTVSDRLSIDFGQGWDLIGVQAALKEAMEHVKVNFKEE